MESPIKIIIFLLGVTFVITVLYLLIKRKINERNSFFWLAGALIILLLSTAPELLDVIAQAVHVHYPPTLLFLLSVLVILFIQLYQSIQISILQEKCKELSQYQAIAGFTEKSGWRGGKEYNSDNVR